MHIYNYFKEMFFIMTKYSGFFYSKDGGKTGKYVDLEDALSNLNNYADFKNKYDNMIYCPECHKAILFLTINTKKHPFLRKKPTSEHKAGCSKIYEAGSLKETSEYIEHLTDDQIKNKVNSMFANLFGPKSTDRGSGSDNTGSTPKNGSPFSFGISTDKSIRRSFRVRSLKSYIDQDDDKDKVYLIYGKAKLSVLTQTAKKSGNEYDLLEVDPQDKYHHVYRIYLGKHDERSIDPNSEYKVLFIGKYNFSFKYHKEIEEDGEKKKIRVWNFDLINNNLQALKYEKCN